VCEFLKDRERVFHQTNKQSEERNFSKERETPSSHTEARVADLREWFRRAIMERSRTNAL